MAIVKVDSRETSGKSMPEVARTFYEAAHKAVDTSRRGEPTVSVPAHVLIDLMIAYEDAIAGDTGNLEWALAVQAAIASGAETILEEAGSKHWRVGDFDSPSAKLLSTDPYSSFMKKYGEKGVREAGRRAYLNITTAGD